MRGILFLAESGGGVVAFMKLALQITGLPAESWPFPFHVFPLDTPLSLVTAAAAPRPPDLLPPPAGAAPAAPASAPRAAPGPSPGRPPGPPGPEAPKLREMSLPS